MYLLCIAVVSPIRLVATPSIAAVNQTVMFSVIVEVCKLAMF